MNKLPLEVQHSFVEAASVFIAKTGADFEDVKEFMIEVIKIYHEYLTKEK